MTQNTSVPQLQIICYMNAQGSLSHQVYFENRTLLTKVTSTSPTFSVSHLEAGTNYQLKVYVTYGPVTSPPVVVSAYTSEAPRSKCCRLRASHVLQVLPRPLNEYVGAVVTGLHD